MSEDLETHLLRQIDTAERFFWHRLRWRAVRGYLPRNSLFELLDVGAGAGLVGTYLKRDCPDATYRFVEPIASLGQRLTEQYGVGADASGDPDFATAQFVVLLDVLEHQADDRAFMADLVGKMAPGSMLFVTVPALPRLWSSWDTALGHVRRYEKASLVESVTGLPLKIHETSFLCPEMVPLAALRARRRTGHPHHTAGDDVGFPDLPGLVNDAMFGVGMASLSLRRHWKRGTSLFLAATVTI
jgi:hypothetical protein